jgi:hypothetical protein
MEGKTVKDDKKMELLKKLKALADRGERGERDAAQKKLTELMEKFGVEDADLSDEKLEDAEFRYRDRFEEKILQQVFYKVNHEREVYVYTKSRAKVLLWRCTKAEAIQAGIEYEFFNDLWRDEVKLFLEAFIQKHRIFRTGPDAPKGEIDEEIATRMYAMMQGMQDKQLTLRIEERSGTQ